MKTRDRILECALQLFNQKGEPNVSTMEVANEMGISPGNLYYHFHGKEPLVLGLFERFQNELAPLLDPPAEAQLEPQDYWLFLHLIVERMAQYRFLFQDLSNLAGRLPKLAKGIRNLLTALAGRFPSEEVSQTFTLASLHLPRTLPVSLPSRLIEQRPDVKAAEAAVHAASAQVGVAVANRLPQFTI